MRVNCAFFSQFFFFLQITFRHLYRIFGPARGGLARNRWEKILSDLTERAAVLSFPVRVLRARLRASEQREARHFSRSPKCGSFRQCYVGYMGALHDSLGFSSRYPKPRTGPRHENTRRTTRPGGIPGARIPSSPFSPSHPKRKKKDKKNSHSTVYTLSVPPTPARRADFIPSKNKKNPRCTQPINK